MLSSLSSPTGQLTIQHLLISDGDGGKLLFDQELLNLRSDEMDIRVAMNKELDAQNRVAGFLRGDTDMYKYSEFLVACKVLFGHQTVDYQTAKSLLDIIKHGEADADVLGDYYWDIGQIACGLKLGRPDYLDPDTDCPNLLSHLYAPTAPSARNWDHFEMLQSAFMTKVLKTDVNVRELYRTVDRMNVEELIEYIRHWRQWIWNEFESPVTHVAYLKVLMPEHAREFERDQDLWDRAVEQLEMAREEGRWRDFAWEAAMLKIVGSERAEITDRGIELSGFLRQPAESAPPLPFVRHQISEVVHA